jgi:hypothetical protein
MTTTVPAVPEGRTQVPVALLPIDALAKLRLAARVDVRRHPQSKPQGRFAWVMPPAIGLLTLGGLETLFVADAGPFGMTLRWLPLLLGGALLGAYLVWKQIPRFAPDRGQGMLLSTASLVLIDAREVEVLPAEQLAITDSGITFAGQLIDDGFHERVWVDELRAIVARATSDVAARNEDRFRQAAARAVSAPAAGRAASTPVLVGAGLGLALGLFLEAGPVGARGGSRIGDAKSRFTSAIAAAERLSSLVGPRADQGIVEAEQALAKKKASQKKRHDNDLEIALNGTLESARSFLSNAAYSDKGERTKVLARYATLADKVISGAKFADELRTVVADCDAFGCENVDKARERFAKLALQEVQAAKKSDDIEHFLGDAQRFGLGQDFDDKVRARYNSLAAKEALTGTIDQARAYLNDSANAASPDRYKVVDRVKSLCEKSYPSLGTLAFHSTILRRLCLAGGTRVTYEIQYGTDKDLGEKAAKSFAKDLGEVAALLNAPMVITSSEALSHEQAMVRVAVTLQGTPTADPGNILTKKQPCTITIRGLDTTGSPIPGQSSEDQATCSTTTTYSPRYGGTY